MQIRDGRATVNGEPFVATAQAGRRGSRWLRSASQDIGASALSELLRKRVGHVSRFRACVALMATFSANIRASVDAAGTVIERRQRRSANATRTATAPAPCKINPRA